MNSDVIRDIKVMGIITDSRCGIWSLKNSFWKGSYNRKSPESNKI